MVHVDFSQSLEYAFHMSMNQWSRSKSFNFLVQLSKKSYNYMTNNYVKDNYFHYSMMEFLQHIKCIFETSIKINMHLICNVKNLLFDCVLPEYSLDPENVIFI